MSKSRERQKARRMAVQALYSWEMSGTDLETIEAGFHTDNNMTKVDQRLFHSLLFGVPRHLLDLDKTI
ncbi:N utilization substance protein B, partial [Porticoccaceae bacterium]|nr:N utilization substance protein B [Porticoccaceae bacterium]